MITQLDSGSFQDSAFAPIVTQFERPAEKHITPHFQIETPGYLPAGHFLFATHPKVRQLDPLWIEASLTLPAAPKGHRRMPLTETEDSARSMMSDRMQEIIRQLIPLLNRVARIYGVPVQRVTISGFVDPEEENREVVITQLVNLSAASALLYWDKLSPLIEEWISSLPARLAPIASERVAIAVDWVNHDPFV